MKKIISIILACCLLLSCFTFGIAATDNNENVAKLYLCARGGINPVGHMFLYIENISDKELQVGAYTLPKNQGVSVGTWGFKSKNGIGVYYNVESYLISQYGKPEFLSISTDLTQKELDRLSERIVNCNLYELIFLNCAFFTAQSWDTVAPQKVFPLIFPILVRLQMAIYGSNKSLKMYSPDRSQVYRQKSFGKNARLSPVSDGMLTSSF